MDARKIIYFLMVLTSLSSECVGKLDPDGIITEVSQTQYVRFTQTLSERLAIGSHIVFTGTSTDDIPWFEVNIGCGDWKSDRCDIAVHFNARLSHRAVVRNTRRHNVWGPEEIPTFRLFPFKKNEQFTIEVVVAEKETVWTVDGQFYCNFTHRSPSPFAADWVQVVGLRDATLSINKTSYPGSAPAPVEKTLSAMSDSGIKRDNTGHENNTMSEVKNDSEGHIGSQTIKGHLVQNYFSGPNNFYNVGCDCGRKRDEQQDLDQGKDNRYYYKVTEEWRL